MRVIYAWNPDYTWVVNKKLWKECRKRVGKKPLGNTKESDEYWRKVTWLYKKRGGEIKKSDFNRKEFMKKYRRELREKHRKTLRQKRLEKLRS